MLVGALAVAVIGCSRSDDSGPKAVSAAPALPPAAVKVETVRSGSLVDRWTFLGQVDAKLAAEIAAAVEGHVVAVTVREGDRVSKNHVLLRLDGATLAASVEAAKARETGLAAELGAAERQLGRARTLKYPAVSEPELDRFELHVDKLRADLDTQRAETRRLQVELGHHIVRAPFAGAIKTRLVDPGAWINRGQALLSLVALDDLQVLVDVSVDLGRQLVLGNQATLLGKDPLPARIVGIVPALDADTRTMRVRLEPESRPAWLLAGMPLHVEFPVTVADGTAVLVSRDALVRSPAQVRIIKIVDGAAVPVVVEVIASAKGDALVRGEDLNPGDQVVVRGNERLRPGQPLNVAD
jgi:RND family efflux transporter MFP subunit